jgi:DNA replication protein DnaC
MMPKQKPSDPDFVVDQLRRHLSTLALNHIAGHLDVYLDWAIRDSPAPSVLLEYVLGEEARVRLEQRIERRIRTSGLRERKTLEAFEWAFQPKLDKKRIRELGTLEFVRRAEDLMFTGKSGTGKSHILQALALRACQHQMRVRYARCVDLLNDLHAGLADDTYLHRLKRWASPELLVIDDVGLGQVKKRNDEPTAAHTLFDLLDRRHGQVSTALSSNIKLSEWGRYLGDVTLAAAILDRLAMRSLIIEIDGPSYRQDAARKRAQKRERSASKPSPEIEPKESKP